jgi:protein-L-isoaspartate O-methyltransferase
LIKQLSKRGRLVAPVFDTPENSDLQHIWIYDVQKDGSVKKQKGINEAYVDMQNSENQRKRGKENIEYEANN